MADWAFADSYYIILTIFFIYFFQVCLMINKKYLVSHLLGKKITRRAPRVKNPQIPFRITSGPLPVHSRTGSPGPLLVHFRFTSCPLPVHLGTLNGYMSYEVYQNSIGSKNSILQIMQKDGQTNIKKGLLKIPFAYTLGI